MFNKCKTHKHFQGEVFIAHARRRAAQAYSAVCAYIFQGSTIFADSKVSRYCSPKMAAFIFPADTHGMFYRSYLRFVTQMEYNKEYMRRPREILVLSRKSCSNKLRFVRTYFLLNSLQNWIQLLITLTTDWLKNTNIQQWNELFQFLPWK